MRIENTETYGWEAAVRGMRNPMDSWARIDSTGATLGPNDTDLARKLVSSGPEHAKFLRLIAITCDITAPLFWWQEWDTYKVGVTRLSCSTMHKLGTRNLNSEDFEGGWVDAETITRLNEWATGYRVGKDFQFRYDMRSALPWNYLQRSTVSLNYAVARNMHHQRKAHRLPQWKYVCAWIESLPNAEILLT